MSRSRLLVGTVLSLAFLSACQRAEEGAAPDASAAMPPSEVGVVEAKPEAIPFVSELPGRVSATRTAEVRPRVGGIVLERVFRQGADVKEGDPLFRIDPLTFEVAVDSSRAAIAKAEALLIQARQAAERQGTLVESRTTSRANLDVAVANQRSAEADLASAKAQLRASEINLDYATVRAPISGRIGRAIVTEGALVNTTDMQALATIQQLDPVYADIQQPVAELLRLREALKNGTLAEVEPDVARVRLKLDDGSDYPHEGRLLFSEATVERTSGQVTIRAEFPNPDGTLLPGLYVRVAIDQGVDRGALAVPNQAIQRDTAGIATLLLVGKDNVVETRPVTLGQLAGGRTVVATGLAAGDRLIVDGFQKIAPGAPVTPVPWTDGSAPPSPAAASETPSAPAATPAE